MNASVRTFRQNQFGAAGASARSVKPPAIYPAAVATDSDLTIAVDRQQTRLALPMNASDTSMTVIDPSLIGAYNLLSIDAEIVKTTGPPVGNAVPIARGFDGTTPAVHLASAVVSGFIDAYHHNRLAAEIGAIENALGPNLSNISGNRSAVSTSYDFPSQAPGGNLVVGANSITLAPVPIGVNGTDSNHYLYISGGTGTAEPVRIIGGTAVSGAASGTVIVNCAFAHSGAWTIRSASAGIQEALNSATMVSIPPGNHVIYAPITTPLANFTLSGAGPQGTQLWPAPNFPNNSPLFSIGGTGAPGGFDRVFREFTIDFAQPAMAVQVAQVVISGGNLATVTTTGPHGLTNGDTVFLFNMAPTTLNGRFTPITVTGASTFTAASVGVANGTYSTGPGYLQSKRYLQQWYAFKSDGNFMNGMTVDHVSIFGAYTCLSIKAAYSGGWTTSVSDIYLSNMVLGPLHMGIDLDGNLGTFQADNVQMNPVYQSPRSPQPGGWGLYIMDDNTHLFRIGRSDTTVITRCATNAFGGTFLAVVNSDGGDVRSANVIIDNCYIDGANGINVAVTSGDPQSPNITVSSTFFYLTSSPILANSASVFRSLWMQAGGKLLCSNCTFEPSTDVISHIDPIRVHFTNLTTENAVQFIGCMFAEFRGVTTDVPFLTQQDGPSTGTVSVTGSKVCRYGTTTYATPAFDFQQSSVPNSVQVVFSGNNASRLAGLSSLYKIVTDDNHVANNNTMSGTGTAGWKTEYPFAIATKGIYQQWNSILSSVIVLGDVLVRSTDNTGFFIEGRLGTMYVFDQAYTVAMMALSPTGRLQCAGPISPQNSAAGIYSGAGSPNTVVAAPPGSLYMNTSGGAAATLWVKESGAGNTGWVAK